MAAALTPTIRPETSADHAAIHALTRRAFAPMPYAGGDEQELIDKLRHAGALTLSLVAEHDGSIVGHIAFSPAYPADGAPGWFALGPVSAEPGLQHRGIGSALIERGIGLLRQHNAAGCVLTGNPAYFRRFGFLPFPALCPDGQPAQFFQILPLGIAEPGSIIVFHPLFSSQASP